MTTTSIRPGRHHQAATPVVAFLGTGRMGTSSHERQVHDATARSAEKIFSPERPWCPPFRR